MNQLKMLIGGCVMFSQLSWAKDEVRETAKGIAKTSSGEIVYTEEHLSIYNSENKLIKLETRYYDEQKNNFGHIFTNYKMHPYLPDYEFKDERRHRQVNVDVRGDTVQAKVSFGKGAEPKLKTYPLKPLLIAGQGLHNYLRSHIDEFATNSKKVTEIDFLIPLNEASYSFRIRSKKITESQLTYRVEANSWFMRLVAPAIEITYERKTKRLLVYDGPSNLFTPDGEKMNVVITYEYPETPSSISGNF